jgi:hypothetical protein
MPEHKMKHFFYTAGPIQKENHYYVEPLNRVDLVEICSLVDQQKYFVLHAPRQTGKTSFLFSLMDYLNKEGKYHCVYATDDIDYVVDLGLITRDRQVRISNRIYQEIIPRELTYSTQLTIYQETPWYTTDDGRLDMDKLLTAFQEFFRKQFESWVDGFDYAEAGPQLLLQAFLQRIVNAGGRVEREYGLGRQRTYLLVIWPYKNGVQEVVIELKLVYGSLEKTIEKGLRQTREYMDKCGTKQGYLLVFNRAENVLWEEKIFKKTKTIDGVKLAVYGM